MFVFFVFSLSLFLSMYLCLHILSVFLSLFVSLFLCLSTYLLLLATNIKLPLSTYQHLPLTYPYIFITDPGASISLSFSFPMVFSSHERMLCTMATCIGTWSRIFQLKPWSSLVKRSLVEWGSYLASHWLLLTKEVHAETVQMPKMYLSVLAQIIGPRHIITFLLFLVSVRRILYSDKMAL